MKKTCTQACPPSWCSATTSASSTPSGLIPWFACTLVSARIRSRIAAARSNSIAALACCHRRGELLLHLGRLARQEQHRVLDQRRIVALADQPDAGRAAPLDLEEQAGPRPALEHRVRAGAQQEGLLQLVQRPVDAARRGEGPEVAPRLLAQAAVLLHLRERMVGGDEDVREALVVAEQHVVARLQLLDQVLLEQQRLGLGLRRQEHHRRRRGDHSPYARSRAPVGLA